MTNVGIPELLVVLTIVLICSGILLIPMVFFLLTLQKALSRCAPQNRTMTPGQVWLLLIPLFNIVWNFIVVSRVTSSLGNELRARKLPGEANPGQTIGLAYAILVCCSILPLLNLLAAPAALVCWIVYWVQIADYSGRISMPASAQTANE